MTTRINTLGAETAAWAEAAPQLAEWAERLLVNRGDVWGGYNDIADRDKIMPSGTPLGKSTTRPRKNDRGKVYLTRPHLVRHFEGRRISNIVGLHTTSPENTSRWGAPEIDWHGPDSTGPEINQRAALGWYAKLFSYGARPLLTDSNGAGGFHLLTIFDRPLPTADVFWFCRWLVKDHQQYGLPSRPEHFPKQSKIYPTADGQNRPRTRYGNWLRLPGRHHTRDHWSKVWNGTDWLAGVKAVEYILTVAGNDPALFPWDEIRRCGFHERVAAYRAKLPNLAEGQGRDDIAYGFASWLVRDMKANDAEALDYLDEWDRGNSPPKGRERLAVIIANAHEYGQRAYGSGLDNASGGGQASTIGTAHEHEVPQAEMTQEAEDDGTMTKQPAEWRLESERNGKKWKVTARHQGNTVFIDNIDPASLMQRRRFVKALKDKLPKAPEAEIDAELIRLADESQSDQLSKNEPSSAGEAGDLLATMPQEIREEAHALLRHPKLIQQIVDDIALLNVAGEKELTATIYLTGVSRLLPRPLASIVQGPSTSGKSYLIEKTASLFPAESLIIATQMTPQALFHMRPGTLAHQFIVAGERSRIEDDERAEATRALREMLSSGRLSKLMPMKVAGGSIETVLIEQDGPIAFIESTTLAKVFDEDANRCVLLHTDERPEQTRRVIRELATAYGRPANAAITDRIVQRHHALQRMLRSLPVLIPYSERLAELFVSDRVEVRRAFPHLMSMIQAVTLLHQHQRMHDDGRLIATADDYLLARRLFLKPMTRLLHGGLSDPARRFFDRLQSWANSTFTSTEAKKKESNSKSSVHGWLHELHEAGIVEMVEEGRGRAPAKWRLSGKVPDEASGCSLPEMQAVFPDSTWKREHNAEPSIAL